MGKRRCGQEEIGPRIFAWGLYSRRRVSVTFGRGCSWRVDARGLISLVRSATSSAPRILEPNPALDLCQFTLTVVGGTTLAAQEVGAREYA